MDLLIHRWTESPAEAVSLRGLDGGSSVWFKGRFYPNVSTRKRGRTSMSWPKPKLKFDFPSAVSSL